MDINNIPGNHNEDQAKTVKREHTMSVVRHHGPDARLRMQGMQRGTLRP